MLVLSLQARAQEPNLEDLARQLGKEITKAKFKSVVVTDFTGVDGNSSPAGKVLADRLLDYWFSHHEKFSIVDRSTLDALLGEQKLALKDLDNSETLKKVGKTLGFDAIVTGTVTPNSQGCSLNVVVRRVQDAKLEASASQSFSNLDLPRPAGNHPLGEATEPPVVQAGVNGVAPPVCMHCPDPDYPNELRQQKIEGVVVLSIVVTQDGEVTSPKVLKSPNEAFAKKAIDAVRAWKLKPAAGPDGRPVPAKVMVEVQFRMMK